LQEVISTLAIDSGRITGYAEKSAYMIAAPSGVKCSAFRMDFAEILHRIPGRYEGYNLLFWLFLCGLFSAAIPIKTYWYQDFIAVFPFSMFLK
jgi:hypothetical protein